MRWAVLLVIVLLVGCTAPRRTGPPPCDALAATGGLTVQVHVATNGSASASPNGRRAPASVAGACVRASQEQGIPCCPDVARGRVDAAGDVALSVPPGRTFITATIWAGFVGDGACTYEAPSGDNVHNITGPTRITMWFDDGSYGCATP